MRLYIGITVPELEVVMASDDHDAVQNAINQRPEQCDILETDCVHIGHTTGEQETNQNRKAIQEKVREYKANPDAPEAQPVINAILATYEQLQSESHASTEFRVQQAVMAHMTEIWNLIANGHGWPKSNQE